LNASFYHAGRRLRKSYQPINATLNPHLAGGEPQANLTGKPTAPATRSEAAKAMPCAGNDRLHQLRIIVAVFNRAEALAAPPRRAQDFGFSTRIRSKAVASSE
jgi:hypothetical protein